MIKIIFHADKCVGCQACTTVCKNWVVNGSIVKPKKTTLIDIGCNDNARQVCPVGAIEIK